MAKKTRGSIKLRKLRVRNFKALDALDIEFPPPRMDDDPDVLVMGSRNGVGKTSILESCALLVLGAAAGEEGLRLDRYSEMSFSLNELLIRAGAQKATIDGTFLIDGHATQIKVSVAEDGPVRVAGNTEAFRDMLHKMHLHPSELGERFLSSLVSFSAEPLLLPPFLYFHSYRKVQEGNPELGMMVEGARPHRRTRFRPVAEMAISSFKLEILRSMMSRASLFETLDVEEADELVDRLNDLVDVYAGGRIEKLRPSPDNTVEFRITPSAGGPSFAFDGLSSGQKEIISTLFLIWRYTRERAGIVLIDEPELHLNAEWHRGLVRQLHELVPDNQYIIATHSEDVFSSVEEDRRLLLQASPEADG